MKKMIFAAVVSAIAIAGERAPEIRCSKGSYFFGNAQLFRRLIKRFQRGTECAEQ